MPYQEMATLRQHIFPRFTIQEAAEHGLGQLNTWGATAISILDLVRDRPSAATDERFVLSQHLLPPFAQTESTSGSCLLTLSIESGPVASPAGSQAALFIRMLRLALNADGPAGRAEAPALHSSHPTGCPVGGVLPGD